MSLIEQLGGYEKAKTKADELDYDLNNLEFLGGGSAGESMYEKLDSIEKALLQYRRQHNVYEVGDWVVSTLNLGSEPESMVCQIKFFHEGVVTTQSACGEIVNFHSSKFRHATNAEIEAQRRLDLPQVSSIIKANFKNAAGEDIQVVGKVRELKGRKICCNEVGTGKPFFCLPGEFEKYDLPESVVQSLG